LQPVFFYAGCGRGVNLVEDTNVIFNSRQFAIALRNLTLGIWTPARTAASQRVRFFLSFPLFQSAYYYYWFYMFSI
jgi:hypothetical protein